MGGTVTVTKVTTYDEVGITSVLVLFAVKVTTVVNVSVVVASPCPNTKLLGIKTRQRTVKMSKLLEKTYLRFILLHLPSEPLTQQRGKVWLQSETPCQL